jgi:hypothetical protein
MAIALLNNYCTVEDVLTLIKKIETPEPLLVDRINTFINQSSRLIDHYCQTKFYEQDFSSEYLDSRFSNIIIKDSSVWFPFPLSQIIEIKENNIVLSNSDYILPSGSISQVYRLNSDGELKDWSGTLKVKAKFGFKGLPSCSTGFKILPFVIRTQCAIFTAYLLGEKKVTGKTKTRTGTEIRQISNIPMNSGIVVDGGNISNQGFAFVPEINSISTTPKTYTGKLDVWRTSSGANDFVKAEDDISVSLGWEAPINEVETSEGTLQGVNLEGFIPLFEFKKLDPYKFS